MDFLRNEKRLKRDPPLKDRYDSVIQEYIDLGHMTEVSPASNSATYYLPHHAVFKPESMTLAGGLQCFEPVRKRDQSEPHSYAGATSNDVSANLGRPQAKGPLQRILFRSPDGDIRDYELKTVTFSFNYAPFLAIRALQQLAYDEESKYPQASQIIRHFTFGQKCSCKTFGFWI
ncbi:uncharacterized protein [Drosophila bipectinata]|uniref:uncharacterized protein n=1 Tax=Drosophila bipectinata TaxID=42026 RepID=UPI0038B24C99